MRIGLGRARCLFAALVFGGRVWCCGGGAGLVRMRAGATVLWAIDVLDGSLFDDVV